jgi:hypothetical protein
MKFPIRVSKPGEFEFVSDFELRISNFRRRAAAARRSSSPDRKRFVPSLPDDALR